MHNIAIQLVMQQCCKTSYMFLLPVLFYLCQHPCHEVKVGLGNKNELYHGQTIC